MPYLTFAGDRDHELASAFAAAAIRSGAVPASAAQLVHLGGDDRGRPRRALAATDAAFAAVAGTDRHEGGVAHER